MKGNGWYRYSGFSSFSSLQQQALSFGTIFGPQQQHSESFLPKIRSMKLFFSAMSMYMPRNLKILLNCQIQDIILLRWGDSEWDRASYLKIHSPKLSSDNRFSPHSTVIQGLMYPKYWFGSNSGIFWDDNLPSGIDGEHGFNLIQLRPEIRPMEGNIRKELFSFLRKIQQTLK